MRLSVGAVFAFVRVITSANFFDEMSSNTIFDRFLFKGGYGVSLCPSRMPWNKRNNNKLSAVRNMRHCSTSWSAA